MSSVGMTRPILSHGPYTSHDLGQLYRRNRAVGANELGVSSRWRETTSG